MVKISFHWSRILLNHNIILFLSLIWFGNIIGILFCFILSKSCSLLRRDVLHFFWFIIYNFWFFIQWGNSIYITDYLGIRISIKLGGGIFWATTQNTTLATKKHCSKHFFIANTSLIFFGKCKNIVFAMFFIQKLRSMHNVGVYSSALLWNSNWIKLWMLLWNRAGLFQGKALVWREQRWINPCEHIRIVQGECICAQRDKLCCSHKWMVSTDPFLAKE